MGLSVISPAIPMGSPMPAALKRKIRLHIQFDRRQRASHRRDISKEIAPLTVYTVPLLGRSYCL